ncbi:sperm-associated antigen 1 [Tenrec ecaudatus]|uniref:sperm-associated antigen 1 n=1 Tax=Tenrec ecaudatus TaxID=94439 RepID=UPI003F5AB8CE
MTDQDCPTLWGFGTTKKFKIPIEHLDFKYIEKCSDVKQLEKIYCVLRSGEEGYYPELTEFCEKRLESLAPHSRALRKDKPVATASSFTAEEWEKIDGDMKSWVSEIKKEENKIHFHGTRTFPATEDNLPPIRGSSSCLPVAKEKCSKSKPAKKKIPRDYAEWDKFDVEKECSKIDDDYKEDTVINKIHLSKIETRIDTAGRTNKEKDLLATREREKGNEAFNSGDFEEAVMYYTRSISVLPTVAAWNNRAQAEIKLQNWTSAFQDCQQVLKLEPGNLKALLRRATTYKHQNKLQEAVEDLSQVLEVEPDNDLAKKMLLEVKEDLNNAEPVPKTQTKGKRLVIQEVESSEDEDGKDRGRKHEEGSEGKTAAESAGAGRAGEPRAMGNVQKKFAGGRGEGGRRTERAAPGRERAPRPGADPQGRPRTPASASPGGAYGHPGGGRDPRDPAAGLKERGNELFRGGQFTEAAQCYSEAIAQLEPAGSERADELSVLYSNRAACCLKGGHCSGCIQDCTRALELQPFSVKPLLRRAMAYETLEQYRQAYVDYKTVLQVDCGIQVANDSINRITRLLTDLDGLTWREKLPPIPSVPTSMQVRAWHPAAETSLAQVGDSLHQAGIPDEKKFRMLKEAGNQCVKDQNYREALSKYSECLKINNKECAIYTNRALCYLKLGQFEAARQDCDLALQIDGGSVKACYRRALAHKGLKNYQQSFSDLNKVLLLDPSVAEAKMELEEVTRCLQSKDNKASFNKERERRKIMIQEVTGDGREVTSLEGSIACPASEKGEVQGPPEPRDKLWICKPNNAYEFGQIMSAINTRKDPEACAELLACTKPEDLPMLLSNKLEGDMFLLLIQALKHSLVDQEPSLIYRHLFYLSQAERFKMMLTLISKSQKEQIEQLFNDLSNTSDNQLAVEDLQALKRQYEL